MVQMPYSAKYNKVSKFLIDMVKITNEDVL
jgi:hypothetical protein